jgi:murein L,D-transpeptidase YcbB/YkuD
VALAAARSRQHLRDGQHSRLHAQGSPPEQYDLATRIVVGKPETQTPLLSAEIENILLNPTWNVPESIIYNEYLPALQRDPRALQRMGLMLERAPDGRLTVKQPPGEANALGRMKINFSNRFHVYLHDTPTKHLFARPRRAYSHGCMRVENPAKFGEVLLSLANPKDGYTEARLQQAWGGPEQWIKFRRKIPVHLVYMSAYVDENGKLVVRNDIYEFDKKTMAILKGNDMRMADSYTAPAPKPTVIEPDKRRELERYVQDPRAYGPGPGPGPQFDFFERLFAPRR